MIALFLFIYSSFFYVAYINLDELIIIFERFQTLLSEMHNKYMVLIYS